MQILFRVRGFRFFFYSNEGNPAEPVQVHVEKDGQEAKFWITPDVRLAYNDGFTARVLRELADLVEANRETIERAWHDFFGPGDRREI
jgi:hypothetical protein